MADLLHLVKLSQLNPDPDQVFAHSFGKQWINDVLSSLSRMATPKLLETRTLDEDGPPGF
jgi:hypothetical protein